MRDEGGTPATATIFLTPRCDASQELPYAYDYIAFFIASRSGDVRLILPCPLEKIRNWKNRPRTGIMLPREVVTTVTLSYELPGICRNVPESKTL